MRRLLPLLLLVALPLAGCLSGDDGGAQPPTVSSPPPASPTPPASTPPAGATPSPTPASPAPPAAREAKVVYNGTHDFAGPPPAPNAPPRTENFTVDAGYATLQVRIAMTSTSGPTGELSLGTGVAVRVLDPAGAAVAECTKKDDPTCSVDVAAPAAGEWKVEYVGSGTNKATVTITLAP